MAHMARIENGIVVQVIVINNDVMTNSKGIEDELLAQKFCKSLFGKNTEWVQTSYNSNFRGKFAGIGDVYDPDKDEFFTPVNDETLAK